MRARQARVPGTGNTTDTNITRNVLWALYVRIGSFLLFGSLFVILYFFLVFIILHKIHTNDCYCAFS